MESICGKGGREPCEIAAIKEADSASTRRRPGGGGPTAPNIGHKCPELALNGTYVVPKWYEPLGRGHLTYCL